MPPAISGVRLARTRVILSAPPSQCARHETGQHIDLEQRDLVAPEHDQRGRRAGGRAPAPGRAIERARKQPECDRQLGEADHLSGVLQPRARGAAEREGERRDERARRMPAAVAEIQDDPESAEEEIART